MDLPSLVFGREVSSLYLLGNDSRERWLEPYLLEDSALVNLHGTVLTRTSLTVKLQVCLKRKIFGYLQARWIERVVFSIKKCPPVLHPTI